MTKQQEYYQTNKQLKLKYQQERRLLFKLSGTCHSCGKPKYKHYNKYETCYGVGKTEKQREYLNNYRKTVKDLVYKAYGGFICNCCGKTEVTFLSIDHVNNDGNKHRKEIKGYGNALYAWIKRNNFPPGFQVLCFNCNHGRFLNGGLCPHKENKISVQTV